MLRILSALASLHRRWKYIEDHLTTTTVTEVPSGNSDLLRTRRAIERGERLLADYRLNGCEALARECETSLRALRTHLSALEF